MSKADATKFLDMLEKDKQLQKKLDVEQSMVDLGKQCNLTFTVDELDEAIDERAKSKCSWFLEGLGFSEVPGF